MCWAYSSIVNNLAISVAIWDLRVPKLLKERSPKKLEEVWLFLWSDLNFGFSQLNRDPLCRVADRKIAAVIAFLSNQKCHPGPKPPVS